ncbi:MAG: protein kinase [bacterium]
MIGQKILHYQILEKLGEGGMGVVYKAEDTRLKRDVAIKFLPRRIAASEEERKRFKIEAQAAAALNHPNIATIHAIEEHDDEMFIVMEYIEGQELREIVGATGPVAPTKAINYASQIAAGLQAAHEKGIVHRDIKSSNIMITDKGQVKIMDFGLAKVHGGQHLTKSGITVGTVAYMSPEQAKGMAVDHRTDIWAFGVVLYEMLTGQQPFKGDYEQAVIYSIVNEEPEPMADIAPEVELKILKTLAKDPADRYQTADEVVSDLQQIGAEPSGKRKPGRKGIKLHWVVVSFVLITAIAVYLFRTTQPPIVEKEPLKTIAVLPFADMSPNKDQEYFSDGLAEELLNVLARNPALRVTSRTSAFSFKGSNTDIRTIAAKLNVQHILEGSVRKSGNQIRVTTQLIDVATDAHLWSNTYDGTLDNIFAVQDTISRSVARALQVALLGSAAQTVREETSPAAYNAYLQALHFFKLRTRENFEKAIGYYEQALALDPGYARAWVGLSVVHSRQANAGYIPLGEGYGKARQEAQKALELAPNLGGAHAQMGWLKRIYDWDWNGADAAYRRALAIEPRNAVAARGAAHLAATLGRFEEALALDRRAIELDPVNAAARVNHSLHAYYAGRLEEAEAACWKVLELNPQYPGGHLRIGRVYLEKGNPDSALLEIKREPEPVWQMFGFALVYHALGKKREADASLAAFTKAYEKDAAFQIAEIYAYRGETDRTFEWLERAYDQRDGGLSEIKGDPLLRSIETDPRYATFMKKMKLPL